MSFSSRDDANGEDLLLPNVIAAENSPQLPMRSSQQFNQDSFSAPLENSTLLEAPRPVYFTAAVSALSAVFEPQVAILDDTEMMSHEPEVASFNDEIGALMIDEITVPLMAERLVIDRRRRKIGEVVIRKEIDTYMVEVPIRRERLIVEQISPDFQQLAVVDLGQPVDETDFLAKVCSPTVEAKFTTASAAIEFIEAITRSKSGLAAMRVSVVLEDENLHVAYQQWLESHVNQPSSAQIL